MRSVGRKKCCYEVFIGSSSGRTAAGTATGTILMQSGSTFAGAGWDFGDETANGSDDFWDRPSFFSEKTSPRFRLDRRTIPSYISLSFHFVPLLSVAPDTRFPVTPPRQGREDIPSHTGAKKCWQPTRQ